MTFIDIAKDTPQRHRGHREDTEPAGHVTTTKTQRHEDITKFPRLPARSRPPGGRGPLGAGAASDASARSCTHSQRPALSESAGLASRVDQTFAFEQVRMRRDRRALRVGRGKVRPRRMLASGAVGLFTGGWRSSDRRLPAAPLRATSPTEAPLLCVLCVFVVATILRSVASVPLWLAGCGARIRLQRHDSGKNRGRSPVQSKVGNTT